MTTSQPNVPYGSAPQFTLVVGELRLAWPVLMLRGFLALLFGALSLLWPGITVLALAILFGAYALVDGVGLLIDAVRRKDRPHRALDVVAGIAGIGAGIIAFIWPAITALALAILIGAWALVTGVAEIVAAVRLRKRIEGEWIIIAAGVLSVIAGVLLLIRPDIGAFAIALTIGAYAIVAGVMMIFLAFRLRAAGHEGTTAPATAGRTTSETTSGTTGDMTSDTRPDTRFDTGPGTRPETRSDRDTERP